MTEYYCVTLRRKSIFKKLIHLLFGLVVLFTISCQQAVDLTDINKKLDAITAQLNAINGRLDYFEEIIESENLDNNQLQQLQSQLSDLANELAEVKTMSDNELLVQQLLERIQELDNKFFLLTFEPVTTPGLYKNSDTHYFEITESQIVYHYPSEGSPIVLDIEGFFYNDFDNLDYVRLLCGEISFDFGYRKVYGGFCIQFLTNIRTVDLSNPNIMILNEIPERNIVFNYVRD
jgi:hypothetical protein